MESDEHERAIPAWVKQHLIQGPPSISVQRITFFLESLDNHLEKLPTGHARLTASRLLKISKVAEYVVDNLKLKLPTREQFEAMEQLYRQSSSQQLQPSPHPTNSASSNLKNAFSSLYNRFAKSTVADEIVLEENPVKAHEFLEIWCNGKQLKSEFNLGVANKFFRDPNTSVITLGYKLRYPVPIP